MHQEMKKCEKNFFKNYKKLKNRKIPKIKKEKKNNQTINALSPTQVHHLHNNQMAL